MATKAAWDFAEKNNVLYPVDYLDQEGYKLITAANGKEVAANANVAEQTLRNKLNYVFTASNLLSTFFQGGQGYQDIIIPKGTEIISNMLTVAFQATVANAAVTLAPFPLCFWKIEIRTATDTLQTFTGEHLMAHYGFLDLEQAAALNVVAGISPNTNNTNAVMPSGAVRSFYLTLFADFLSVANVYLGLAQTDIFIRCHPCNTGSALVSGTSTNVTLTGASAILECIDLPSDQKAQVRSFFQNHTVSCPVTTGIEYTATTTSFNSGSEYKIPLNQQIIGLFPLGFWCFRASTANTSMGRWTFTGIDGESSYMGLVSASGENINGGSYLNPLINRLTMWPKYLPSPLTSYNAIYPWIHSDDPKSDIMNGSLTGCQSYIGTEQFVFNAAATGETAEVQTITANTASAPGTANTAASGSFCIQYRNNVTAPMAYNSSSATVQAALQALPAVIDEGLTVTCAGTLSSGSSGIAITIAGLRRVPSTTGGVFVLINSSLASSAPAALVGVTVITTTGVVNSIGGKGFANGANALTLNAYYWQRQSIQMTPDGRILKLDK
jgi:hypothetical protein